MLFFTPNAVGFSLYFSRKMVKPIGFAFLKQNLLKANKGHIEC